ncbi:MAG: MBL fold metallo-hydrolase [Pseudomonadales bacterium]
MLKPLVTALAVSSAALSFNASAAQCDASRVKLQVLGSGGPQLDDGRASSSYLVWVDGKAKVMIDTGPGSSVNYGKAGANYLDLEAIALSHLHVDHSSDLPAYLKGGFFAQRIEDIKLFGPTGNARMPSIQHFVDSVFGEKGAYPYLSGYFVPWQRNYTIEVVTADAASDSVQRFAVTDDIRMSAIGVQHGQLPAVAWRVDVAGCAITFSGDMSGRRDNLQKLAQGSDILVAHHAVPEGAGDGVAGLHMRPSKIAQIAAEAEVGQVVLSHRMSPSIGREDESREHIAKRFKGEVHFADDMDSFTP